MPETIKENIFYIKEKLHKMKHIDKIEKYLLHEMNQAESSAFETDLMLDQELKSEFQEYKTLFDAFNQIKEEEFVKKQIAIAREQDQQNINHITSVLKGHVTKYWKTAAVAASVAFLASTTTFFVAKKSFIADNNNRIIQLVNKDIRAIQKKQVDIQKDLNEVKNNVVPDYPSDFAGTGFALTNNGFILTNLHVINGGSQIFIFTKDGRGHKCEMVAQDKDNDIAILKVLDENIIFSSKPLPYRLQNKIDLAEPVFTLGFPKDEIVYNEGYISSLNGKDGDPTKYQLELPSSPGVSGAPVLNAKGDLVGIINSKESQSKGITYAIKAEILNKMLDTLSSPYSKADLESNAIAGYKRADQIKQLQDLIFVVKVYK